MVKSAPKPASTTSTSKSNVYKARGLTIADFKKIQDKYKTHVLKIVKDTPINVLKLPLE